MLQQLGINSTVFIQFLIFTVTFVILVKYVYAPFSEQNELRQKKTKGSVEIADELKAKTTQLQGEFSEKAKDLNAKISAIFSGKKADANAESEKILNEAKSSAASVIENNRKVIETNTEKLNKELLQQTPALALAITNKLLGKN